MVLGKTHQNSLRFYLLAVQGICNRHLSEDERNLALHCWPLWRRNLLTTLLFTKETGQENSFSGLQLLLQVDLLA